MTPEEERWAEAGTVLRQHGEMAFVFVAERIGALALEGDVAGIARWKEIAVKIEALVGAPHV